MGDHGWLFPVILLGVTLVPIVLMVGSLYAFKRQVERIAVEVPVTA